MHTDQEFMREAYLQALKSFQENGIPIGAILVRDNVIIGRGHNRRVQHGDPIAHGEMDCIKNAGRQANYKNTTLYTTLSPCKMCSGVIVQYKIPRVVIGESDNFKGNIEYLRENGVEVLVLNDRECANLLKSYDNNNHDTVLEDIGGHEYPGQKALSSKTISSARVLLQLYTVAMGVAFSIAAKNCFTATPDPMPFLVKLALFMAYAATFIPFFHGCAALFQDTYIDRHCCQSKLKVLFFDFALMFIHAFFFSILADFITQPATFYRLLICLFIVDIIWCVFADQHSPSPRQRHAAQTWLKINKYMVIPGSIIALFTSDIASGEPEYSFAFFTLVCCSVRTYFDYAMTWDEYFGKDRIS